MPAVEPTVETKRQYLMLLDRVFVQVTDDQLRLLLLTLAGHLEAGFTPAEVDAFCAGVVALEPDDDLLAEPTVSFQGEELPFAVDVFKDEHGDLEAVFLLAPVLTPLVEDEARSLAGATSVRSLLGKQGT
jgi:hypothetical protein